MVKRVVAPSPLKPFLDEGGSLSSESRAWTQLITSQSLIIGTGSPDGIIEAIQGSKYMDDTGTAGAILYIKRDSDVGGDKSLGWILV